MNGDLKKILIKISQYLVNVGSCKIWLIKAIKYAKKKRSKVISIIGRKDGFAYKNSNAAILVNVNNKKFITPVTETFQVLVWHLLVTHPTLQINKTKW